MRLTLRIAVALLALGLGTARAQEGPVVISSRDGSTRPLDARPTERSVASFADVIRALYPDLDAAGRAARFAGARAVPDAVAGGDSPAGPAEIDLAGGGAASFSVISEGERDHVAMLVAGVLVLAQVAPEFRATDGLLVQTDPGGSPSIAQMLLLGEARPAAVVLNGHHNSHENFSRHLIATAVEGRLQQVFQGPLLYSVQANERGCEPRRLDQRMLPIALREARRDGFAELSMTVREARICTQRGRARTLNSVVHHARLRWDPAQSRYLGGLDALERRNRRMMGEP
ncbi:hypothetical protein EJV46_07365 [Roseococcus sp. SYP-B2431]|uniref:hypothetical protein n=1 Tax=Roseococcus sp. SYP-B2431 TaxID=2496640 RepID=UPI00103F3C73|nr:hypothetical protein [Roseococcus sp. SYP-B2431]TCI00443.1 hypothetical protein EJV46_07365 [Roseococcus sp. SYP-B2431]